MACALVMTSNLFPVHSAVVLFPSHLSRINSLSSAVLVSPDEKEWRVTDRRILMTAF